MIRNFNKKPLILKNDTEIIISFNGRKLIKPIDGFKNLTEEEILDKLFVEGGEIDNG